MVYIRHDFMGLLLIDHDNWNEVKDGTVSECLVTWHLGPIMEKVFKVPNGRVAWRLECLPTVPKTTVREPPRTNGWKLAHCSPDSKRGPDGNTGEIEAVRKGTGHPTSQC